MQVLLKDSHGEYSEIFKTVYSPDQALAEKAGGELAESLMAVVRIYDCEDENSPSISLVKEIVPLMGS